MEISLDFLVPSPYVCFKHRHKPKQQCVFMDIDDYFPCLSGMQSR